MKVIQEVTNEKLTKKNKVHQDIAWQKLRELKLKSKKNF